MQYLYFVLAGVIFGLANVIPGVSGGTMAVVFGIYERLIDILSNPLRKIREEWRFLCTFAVGLLIGILAFGKLMDWVLTHYPAQAAMFFVGVILGSLPMLVKSAFYAPAQKKWRVTPAVVIALAAGFAVMVPMILSGDNEAAKEAAEAAAGAAGINVGQILLMLLYGVIASSTMIIPGISGSFVMLLLGVYGTLIGAVAGLVPIGAGTVSALLTLLPFGVGVVLGLVFCSRLIKFLLARYPAPTYAAILGFVAGSIGCVFPGFGSIDVIGVLAMLLGLLVLWGCERLAPAKKE